MEEIERSVPRRGGRLSRFSVETFLPFMNFMVITFVHEGFRKLWASPGPIHWKL